MPYKTKRERNEYARRWYTKNTDKCKKKNRRSYLKHQKERIKFERARRNRHRLLMNRLKVNGCAICGYNKCTHSLDFHHVNPQDKKFQISAHQLSFKDERIVDELNKCILLCRNCHGEIHEKIRKYERYLLDDSIHMYQPTKRGEK